MAGTRRLLGDDGSPLELTLYKFDACPYCRRVQRVIDELELAITYRDTRHDPGAREELVRIGGKNQVPCLLIDGAPMYESADIAAFLRSRPGA